MARITRRQFVGGVAAAATALALSKHASGQPARRKPNFVFIIIDDLGWTDVGCMGSKFYETPNIDKLAKQGVIFTNAYTNAPNCAPTRACIISGQYTPRHGVYTVGSSERGLSRFRKLIPIPNNTNLAPTKITIAEALKTGGYATACIGKWHLGVGEEYQPDNQGFDVAIGKRDLGYWGGHFKPPLRRGKVGDADREYLTDRLPDESLKFIEANRDKPFFLYLAHHAVHTPLQAKRALVEKYEKKKPVGGHWNPVYAAMIESVDESVGRIMRKLDELGLTEDTVVFFFSDNGGVGGYEELGMGRWGITSNKPLRGGKGMLYEGGIRVPLIVRYPNVVKAGTRCDTPVIGIDFYPTILDIAGISKPRDYVLDGESILPLLKGEGSLKRDAIFWHFPAYLQGGAGKWRTTPAGAIRIGDFKLLEFFEDGKQELYNLKEDIGERNNLADAMPAKRRELYERLVAWRESINAPVPTQPNPEYNPSKG